MPDDRAASPHHPELSWPQAREVAAAAARARAVQRLGSKVPLEDARGHVLAEDLRSLTALPAFDTAAMDGWAVVGDGPWRVVGELRAGRNGPTLAPGEALRISTGAVVPVGAGVLRLERGDEGHGDLRVRDGSPSPEVGSDTRVAGEEVEAGEVILYAGAVLTPPAVGLAAASGIDAVTVVPRPTVTVLVLGDELIDRGVPTGGRVRDALSPQLPGWVEALDGVIASTSRVDDTLEHTVSALASATTDLIVTTGGTAKGQADHVLAALERLDGRWLVDGVAVRPGHPMKLGELPDGRLWLALPGNPLAAVSALVSLGEPILSTLSGRTTLAGTGHDVRRPLADSLESSPGAHRLIPATIEDGLVRPALRRGPAMLTGLATADVLAVVPPGPQPLTAGSQIRVLPLPWGSGLVV